MKSKKLFLMSLATLAMVIGCTPSSSSSSSSSSSKPSTSTSATTSSASTSSSTQGLPTELPVYEEASVQIHYSRGDKNYEPWSLWLWEKTSAGKQYFFNYQEKDGLIAYYKLSDFAIDLSKNPTAQLGFIVAKNPGSSWDAKDTDSDRFIEFSNLTADTNGVYHIYIFGGDANIYLTPQKIQQDKITSLYFADKNTIECVTTNILSYYEIFENGQSLGQIPVTTSTKGFTFTFPSDRPFSFDNTYTVKVGYKDSKAVQTESVSLQKLFGTEDFEEAYHYDGNDLGAVYTSTSTSFKVWSPVSSKIVLNVYENGTPTSVDATKGSDNKTESVEMTKGEKGVFSAHVLGDLEGKYYTYTVYNATYPEGKEVVDPYAKSTGVNGLRGMVVDFSKTNPTGWDSVSAHQYDRKELTVWETHVADVTSSATWNGTEANRKKFLGLQEEGTKYTENGVTVKTGFDHIKELGVNAVQFVPIYDQANDEVNPTFNWGYNPLNYNTLEGSYSSNPYDGYARIKEFKKVVKEFNDEGINVIMDVVYNHTASVNGTNFDVLMPGYYYRYTDAGVLHNGSGCGNETASENSMMRKFMIDSTSFWAKEYKLGGFRFDLMALHDIETMNQLTKEAQKINPAITIYGEPWAGGTSGLNSYDQAKQDNGYKYQGYGQFNDKLRDELIKGGLSGASEKSWISNTSSNNASTNTIKQGIKGFTAGPNLEPDKTVNYVTCHDNYTLYDRFKAAGITNDSEIKKMAMLANSVIFTSQGTSFMLAGEEFLRTKGGDHNSYQSSYEVNELDYALKVKHLDMFANYQKLIALKQDVSGLHLGGDDANNMNIEFKDSRNTIIYEVKDTKTGRTYKIIHTNGVNPSSRESIDLTGYTLYLDTLGVLEGNLTSVKPQAFQTIIAYK